MDSAHGIFSRLPTPGRRPSTSYGSSAAASPRTGPRGQPPPAWQPPGGVLPVEVRPLGPPRR
eukprot:10034355-Alexandrium_andersonii.AAC.1